MPMRRMAIAGILICAACAPPSAEKGPQSTPDPAAAAPLSTAAPRPSVPALPTLQGEGVTGTLTVKGQPVAMKHVHARRITGMFDDIMKRKTEEVELILSDRPLAAERLKTAPWSSLRDGYEGLYMRVTSDGTLRNLIFVHPDAGYQTSNAQMKEYAVNGRSARGRHAGVERVGDGADARDITWALAFDAKLPKGPPVQHKR